MNNYNYEYDYINYPNNDSIGDIKGFSSEKSNFDRLNYKPNMDNYKIQFLHNNPTDGNSSTYGMLENPIADIVGIMNKTTNNNLTIDPYKGFIKGNMFKNEYEGYKNYKPMDINSSNERENMLNQIQQYAFALIDLDLYLDVNPNDNNAIKMYNDYLGIKKQIVDKYEKMYGPLTLDSDDLNKNNWLWVRSPWPWEEM